MASLVEILCARCAVLSRAAPSLSQTMLQSLFALVMQALKSTAADTQVHLSRLLCEAAVCLDFQGRATAAAYPESASKVPQWLRELIGLPCRSRQESMAMVPGDKRACLSALLHYGAGEFAPQPLAVQETAQRF